jgi:hypothetical protein
MKSYVASLCINDIEGREAVMAMFKVALAS